jgi:hypothetical protein
VHEDECREGAFFVGGLFDFDGKRLEATDPEAIGQLVDHLKMHARVWFPEPA